nr:hypothetical protein [uncultured Chryseobacterium sp.]
MYFENGKVYLINDSNFIKLDDLKYYLDNKGFDYCFLNFPMDYSLKVNNYYEKMKRNCVIDSKKEISDIIKEEFLLEDASYSEKIILISYCLLMRKDFVIVNTAGMSFESIEYFNRIFTSIISHLNKIIIIYS